MYAPDAAALADVIERIYPGRLVIWRSWKTGRLSTTPLRETLDRQSGMYRAAARISEQELDALVGSFCRSDGGCLRTILWRRDANGTTPSTRFPVSKFDPAADQFGQFGGETIACSVPLLCQEACHLLVAAARRVVKGEA
jgi:hypothetical protein